MSLQDFLALKYVELIMDEFYWPEDFFGFNHPHLICLGPNDDFWLNPQLASQILI